jgi:hypothetical protein
MILTEYYEMIAKADGIKLPDPDPRLTNIEISMNGDVGQQGSATIHLLDGIPAGLSWYVWSLTDEYLMEQVHSKLNGIRVEMKNVSGGNGHMYADLEVIS